MHTVKVPKELLDAHQCEALVITCMDFRFWEAKARFVRDKLGIKSFDLITVPGGCKGVAAQDDVGKYISDVISLSQRLHKIKSVIFINHETCGAYGIDDHKEELETQGRDLVESVEILSPSFRKLEFQAFFAKRGEGEVIFISCANITRV